MARGTRKSRCDVLITGGAGFVGANLAAYLLAHTDSRITLFDEMAEPGSALNLAWLQGQAGDGRLRFVRGDIRNASGVSEAAATADEIYHLAGFTGRIANSSQSEDGAGEGKSNLLEGARRSGRRPIVVSASLGNELREIGKTTPVMGGMGYADSEAPTSRARASQFRPVCVDQLVQDYALAFNLPAVELRIDTVTGPRQFGEGQDWVTRAAYAVLSGTTCDIEKTAGHFHDVLHVSDAVSAILAARAYIGNTAGRAYRVSGGPSHWITVEQMIELIGRISHRGATVPGTQSGQPNSKVAEEDIAFRSDTSWRARRTLEETVRDIITFWHANQRVIASQRAQARPIAPSSQMQAA